MRFIVLVILVVLLAWWLRRTDYFYSPMYRRTLLVDEALRKCRQCLITGDEPENVVVFMSLRYQTLPAYANANIRLVRRYCDRHGYDFVVFDHAAKQETRDVSPYWLRVYDLRRLCSSYPENSILVYLDADATFNPRYHDVPVQNVIRYIDESIGRTSDLYVGSDPPSIWQMPAANEEVANAGVMVWRNTPWTRAFIARWWEAYDPNRWKITSDSRWVCTRSNGQTCRWAREHYEQGALNDLIGHLPSGNVRICHWKVFASDEDGFIVHLMGYPDEKRMEWFAKW